MSAGTPEKVLWHLSAMLPDDERRRVRHWLVAAERALQPPRDALPAGVTARERVHRARLPRPNSYYPGGPDAGQGAS